MEHGEGLRGCREGRVGVGGRAQSSLLSESRAVLILFVCVAFTRFPPFCLVNDNRRDWEKNVLIKNGGKMIRIKIIIMIIVNNNNGHHQHIAYKGEEKTVCF